MKPPVEAPTSRQSRPLGSTPVAPSAFASFSPPRETYRAALRDHELDVLVQLLAGLRVPRHEPGEDERLGLRAALRQPTLDEQDVEALLAHGYAVRTTRPLTISVSTEVSAGISSSIASARSPARSASSRAPSSPFVST